MGRCICARNTRVFNNSVTRTFFYELIANWDVAQVDYRPRTQPGSLFMREGGSIIRVNERIWLGIKKRIREKGLIWERREGFFSNNGETLIREMFIRKGRFLERGLVKEVFIKELFIREWCIERCLFVREAC